MVDVDGRRDVASGVAMDAERVSGQVNGRKFLPGVIVTSITGRFPTLATLPLVLFC